MPTVHEIESALFALAPEELAQEWDNVGLLVGRPSRDVQRVLVALDITEAVIAEAEREQMDLIVAHHPIMNCVWRPVQSIRSDDIQGRKLMRLIEYDISAICMHTNLDAAPGGVNDALAAALELEQVEVMEGGEGIVRTGLLPERMSLQQFLALVEERLKPNGVRYSDGGRLIRKVAVGGGAVRCLCDRRCEVRPVPGREGAGAHAGGRRALSHGGRGVRRAGPVSGPAVP